jgi:hypothetical protein
VTVAPHALRRFVTIVLALALPLTVLVAVSPAASAQSSPVFTDLDQTTHAESIRLVAEDGITRGYPDGTFRPRQDVRRDQMATFLTAALRLEPVAPTFSDVPPGPPHGDNIGAIAEADITRGFPDGTYRPLGYVTRGQLATFLAKGLGLQRGTTTFSDVPEGYVHAAAISALADADPPITQGFPDGTYRPNELVKRDQMAAFLARGIPLPRALEEPACPGSAAASTADATSTREAPATASEPERSGASASSATVRESEDLVELESGDLIAGTSGEATAPEAATLSPDPGEPGAPTGDPRSLGPAIPGTAFPLTSVLRTTGGALEVLTQDLPTSRGARVDAAGDVTATTTVPAGRRTWATAQVGDGVYVGQWGVTAGQPNLLRYAASASGDRTATSVATVPSGNEFWALTADGQGRLWAGTRAHLDGALRAEVGLGNGRDDGRHVVHRVSPTTGQVTNVLFCVPSPPTTSGGVRPDIKQLASVGSTLYVGTGQLTGGARLLAFEPSDRTDIPAGEVRDLTPASVRSATGIFALQADERYVAFGTQAGAGQLARLVVIDRATEQVRANVQLPGETSRVDAVDIRGDRVVATGFSGRVHDVAVLSSGASNLATYPPPVAGQFHRYVEILGDGSLRGVTQQGVVWRRATDGGVDRVSLLDTGAPVAPGLPHGLHVGSVDVAVGASSAATLRSLEAPSEPRTVNISGEGKALTSNPNGDTFIATYPNAGLWRVEAGGDQAVQVGSWTATFLRPAAADHDPRIDRVNVIARDDNAAQSLPRTAPQSNFQFRPSRLFPIDPTPSGTVRAGVQLGRGGAHDAPVTWQTSAAEPIEASALLAGASAGGNESYVGDTLGGVQRVNAIGGQRRWYVPARTADADRPVVDIALIDDRLVVVHSGQLSRRAADGGGVIPGSARTVIRELDTVTGAEVAYHEVSASFAVPDGVTSGPVTVMPSRTVNRYYDRSTGEYWSTSHAQNYSFGGPYIGLDDEGCALYTLAGAAPRPPDTFSELVRSPIALGRCLPTPPDSDPDEPTDPGDQGAPAPGTDG